MNNLQTIKAKANNIFAQFSGHLSNVPGVTVDLSSSTLDSRFQNIKMHLDALPSLMNDDDDENSDECSFGPRG
ncbi:MAG: hypothetical protein Q7K26_01740 [bacterium]|nr:hypothetical protein [bacterium]